MNKKGFTLVELLAVLVVLGIVVSITVPSITAILTNSKAKSEEAFVETIKDAMDIYLSSDAKQLTYKPCPKNTAYSYAVVVENSIERGVRFQDVIDSPYKPINAASLFNPGYEKKCSQDVSITLYRNTNHVYYYVINKKDFKIPGTNDSCFKYTIEDPDAENYNLYISNLKDPENLLC